MIADISEHIAIAHQTLPPNVTERESERILAAQSHAVHDQELPGLSISFSSDTSLLRKVASPGKKSFAGLLHQGDTLSLTSLRAIPDRNGERVITLRVPVTSDFLSTVAPDLGAIQLNLMERYEGSAQKEVIYSSGGEQYKVARRIVASNRTLQDPMLWIDTPVNVVSSFDSVFVAKDGKVEKSRPVLAVFNARPLRLSRRIFATLGELRDSYLLLLIVVGVVFLFIEAAALATGIVLTRRITRAVADLYRGTQYVQAGDFSHRVQIEHHDQLGELAESFNKMTTSVGELIEVENKRRRLENEISIAREVQNQLFPVACHRCRELRLRPSARLRALSAATTMTSFSSVQRISPSPSPISQGRDFRGTADGQSAGGTAQPDAYGRQRALEHGGAGVAIEQASGAQHRRRPVRDILYRDV